MLLSPSGGPDGYFAEFGWIGDAGGPAVPGPRHAVDGAGRRHADRSTTPVTLTYDNGAGLVFTRTIAVDDNYMFTVTDAVENNERRAGHAHPLSAASPASASRTTGGYYILHEGLIGVFGDEGLEEVTYKQPRQGRAAAGRSPRRPAAGSASPTSTGRRR